MHVNPKSRLVEMPRLAKLPCHMEIPRLISWKFSFLQRTFTFYKWNILHCHVCPVHMRRNDVIIEWYLVFYARHSQRAVTKTTPIQFIDGKCHIRKQKSCRTGLASYYAYSPRELLLTPSGWTHTHTLTSWTKAITRYQKHALQAGLCLV